MTSRFVILAIPAVMLTCTLATYSAAGSVPTAATEVPTDSVAEAILDSLPGYDFTNLDEVIVTTRKPLVTSDGANLTYNVEEDPEATSNSLLEMLRKVPSVTVDGEDNIKLNGQSNFKILVNGKEDPMISGGDVSTILKSMPANSVTKIEVLNEPGAK
ncbi:MAG: Plug domain-containing protein [Muribaculaceae bacterium]|nr:Plug domain-containing protein [Muribaculaceae bacterium]